MNKNNLYIYMEADNTCIFINAAITHNMCDSMINQIGEAIKAKLVTNVYVAISGFTKNNFKGKPIAKQLTGFDDYPSNLRNRFFFKIPELQSQDAHLQCQNEITDATFDFFNQVGAIQRDNPGMLNVVFNSLERNSRPNTLILKCIGDEEKPAELALNCNISRKDDTDIELTNKLLQALKEIGLTKKMASECSTLWRSGASKETGNDSFFNGERRFRNAITSDDTKFTKNLWQPYPMSNKATYEALDPESQSQEDDNSLRITFLADLFSLIASLIHRSTLTNCNMGLFESSNVKPHKISCRNNKLKTERPDFEDTYNYCSFVSEKNTDDYALATEESNSFVCTYLNEDTFSKDGTIAKTLLKVCNDLIDENTELLGILKSSKYIVERDDFITDVDDWYFHRFLEMSEVTSVENFSNNSYTSANLNSLGILHKSHYLQLDSGNASGNAKGGGKKKKIRKHQGIYQSGPKAGRLKPGYRYSGKTSASGLKVIAKKVSKK